MRAFVLFFFFIAFCYACRNADPCVAYTTKQDSSTSLSVLIKPQSPCKNRDSLFLIVLGLSGTLCTLFWAIHLLLPFVIARACLLHLLIPIFLLYSACKIIYSGNSSACAYWRRGHTEEVWRSVAREAIRSVAEDER